MIMNIKDALLKEHSRKQCDSIVAYIGTDSKKFEELLKIFLSDDHRLVQRAAWSLSYCAIAQPQLIKKHLKKVILNLKKEGIHTAVKRNTVRLLQEIEIPASLHGEVMDICFQYISDPKEMVAVKAFSLTILGNLSKEYSDIIPELKLVIEDQLPNQSAAFKVRALKLLKQFEKKP